MTFYTVRRLDKDHKPVIEDIETASPELFRAFFPYPIYSSKEAALAIWGNVTLGDTPLWTCTVTYVDGTVDKYITTHDSESECGVSTKSDKIVRITTFGKSYEIIMLPLFNIKSIRIAPLKLEMEDSSTPTA